MLYAFKTFVPALLLFVSNICIAQNNALEFDGSNDYVTSTLSLNGYSAITIEAWVYLHSFNPESPDNYISNVAGHDDASALLRIGDDDASHMTDDNRAQFALYTSNGTDKANATTEMLTNQWYHIAGTYDGSEIKIYVNGILEDTEAHTGTISSTETVISIGGQVQNSRFFDGLIDEVRIWNVARTEAEIRQNMYRELPEPSSENTLVAYYQMNETSGTVLSDSKASANGTLTNMTGAEWTLSDILYGPRKCLDFDGVNNNVWISSFSPTLSGSATIAFWIKLDAIPGNNARVISKGPNYLSGNEVYLKSGTSILSTNSTTFVTGTPLEASTSLSVDEWTYVVITANGTESKLYLNGELDATGGPAAFSYDSFRIGGQYTSGIWETTNAHIDEFSVWNKVLSVEEIQSLMFTSLSGNESGLVAYYNFDNVSGSVLQDLSGNGNDGTLGGMDNSDWVNSGTFNTWLNTSSSDWTEAANWSLGAVPTTSDNVAILATSGVGPVVTGTPTLNRLYLQSNADITVSSDLVINYGLVLDEDLNMNGYNINLNTNAQLYENNGLINGTSGYVDHTESLNAISELNIGGLGATVSSGANLGSTTVKRYHQAITGASGDQGINRYYIIDPTNNSGLDATLVFTYDDSELNGNTESNLKLYKSDDNGSTWTEVGGSVNISNNTITLSSIDDFSWWTAADGGVSLPIEMASFEAVLANETVVLNWSTASEQNNDRFVVERSADMKHWIQVVSVKGAGSSTTLRSYQAIDAAPMNGKNYYRIKQVDFNGSNSYSAIKAIHFSTNQSSAIRIYPNPFDQKITIQNTHDEQIKSFELFDLTGNRVVSIELSPEQRSINFPQDIEAGVYSARIVTADNQEFIVKVVKR